MALHLQRAPTKLLTALPRLMLTATMVHINGYVLLQKGETVAHPYLATQRNRPGTGSDMNSSRSSLLTLGTGTYLHGNPTSRLSIKVAYLKTGICLSSQAGYKQGTTRPRTLLAGTWPLHICLFYTTMRPALLQLQGSARKGLKEVSGPW